MASIAAASGEETVPFDINRSQQPVFHALIDARSRYGSDRPALIDGDERVLTYEEIVRPLSAATFVPIAAAVAPQADRMWEETRPWRDRVARILASINTDEVREHLAEQLKDWIDRFR